MARGQAVELPTTFSVKRSAEPMPAVTGRGKAVSESYLALKAVVAKAKMDVPMRIDLEGYTPEQIEAVERYVRRAANEQDNGVRVVKDDSSVTFQLSAEKRKVTRKPKADENGETQENGAA